MLYSRIEHKDSKDRGCFRTEGYRRWSAVQYDSGTKSLRSAHFQAGCPPMSSAFAGGMLPKDRRFQRGVVGVVGFREGNPKERVL